TRKKDRVSFYKMFEEAVPGSYEKLYGQIISDIAHGGFTAIMFRQDNSDPAGPRMIIGCEFNALFSAFVTEYAFMCSFGFINYADVFFPSMISKMGSDHCDGAGNQIPSEMVQILAD